jgi:hypothetical protein
MNKDIENHPYLNHSNQKTEIVKAHVLHPPSFIYIEREKVDGFVLGLVRKLLEIQHLTMRPEEDITVFCTSPFERVGREPQWGKRGPSKCLGSKRV